MTVRTRTRTLRRLPLLALGCALALGGAAAARAGDDDRTATPEELERVRSALEAKGYRDVHDLDCVVTQGRHDQAFSPEVYGHVIDTACHVLELNRPLPDQRLGGLLGARRSCRRGAGEGTGQDRSTASGGAYASHAGQHASNESFGG